MEGEGVEEALPSARLPRDPGLSMHHLQAVMRGCRERREASARPRRQAPQAPVAHDRTWDILGGRRRRRRWRRRGELFKIELEAGEKAATVAAR